MSKIDDLIRELCPEGVVFSPLSEITNLDAGDRVTKANMDLNGVFPAYGAGTVPTGRLSLYNREHSILISRAGAGAGYVNFVQDKFWATDVCFVAEQLAEGPMIKFVYYWMKSQQPELMKRTYGGAMPKIDKLYLWRHPIPVPPLPVQREIVEILDKFTQLEAELEAELEAREKQLESVRSALLFANKTGFSPPVELTQVCRLESATRQRVENSPYVGVEDLISHKKGAIKGVNAGRTGSSKFFKKEDVLLGNIRPYLRKIWRADEAGETNGDVLVVRALELGKDLISPDFLYQVLASEEYFLHLVSHSKGAKMPRGDKRTALKFQFPLPSLDRQKLVASSLETLSALTQNVSIGLPAEISSRRKQYEYFRDRLLTFKELDAQ